MKNNQHLIVAGKYTDSKGRKVIQVAPSDKVTPCKQCRANPREPASSRCKECTHNHKVQEYEKGRIQLKIKKQLQEK